MLYLLVRGRLGNQFFQYGTVKAVQEEFYPEEEISLVLSDLKKLGTEEAGFKDALVDFKTDYYNVSEKVGGSLWQKLLIFIMRCMRYIVIPMGGKAKAEERAYIFEKKVQPFLNHYGVYFMIQGYTEFGKSKAKDKIFIGNFESAKYFNNIKDKIKKMYTPKYKGIDSNKNLYKVIQNTESVCVTVRRGDFVENNEIKKRHYVCTPEYFKRAINLMEQKKKGCTFVIFSDDVKWARENLKFPGRVYCESGDDPIWEKIRMMSMCKNFIISNSTFSWWAQYLSSNPDKIVIAPSRWKNYSYKKYNQKIDIYEESWITIQV